MAEKSNDWIGPLVFVGLVGLVLWWYFRRRAVTTVVTKTPTVGGPTGEETLGATVAGAACARLGLGGTVASDCAKTAGAVVKEAGALAPSTLGVSPTVGEIGALAATPVTLSTEGTIKGAQIVQKQIQGAQTHWYGQVGTVLGAGVVLPTEAVTAGIGYISPEAGHLVSAGISKLKFWDW